MNVFEGFKLKKSAAIALFGGTSKAMAEALGLSKQRMSEWPENLTDRQQREVLGCALMSGKYRQLTKLARNGVKTQTRQ